MIWMIYGLTSAASWGLSTIFLKSQVNRLPTKHLLALRAMVGTITAILAYVILGKRDWIGPITLRAFWMLLGAVLSGYFGADLAFTHALEVLPVSRAFPIQACYPLVASVLAWYFYGDKLSVFMFIGASIVVAGISLIGSDAHQTSYQARFSETFTGYLLTGLSALGWGISAVLLRRILEIYDPVTVNLAVALITAVCFILVSRLSIIILSVVRVPSIGVGVGLAGLLGGVGISNLLYIITVQVAGVALATILASIAPLFTSFFAMFFLGERLTFRLVTGTILTIIGIGIFVGG